jgi:hypothetical protein
VRPRSIRLCIALPVTATRWRGRLIATGRLSSRALRGYRRLRRRLENMDVLDRGQALFEVRDRLLANRCGGHHVQAPQAGKSTHGGYGGIANVPTQSQRLEFWQACQRHQVFTRKTGLSIDRQMHQLREPLEIPQRRSRQGTPSEDNILKVPQIRQGCHIRFLQREST